MRHGAALLVLALAACADADAGRVRPGEDPFAGFLPVPAQPLGGREVARLDGDYVHPAFSPDGRVLAWSQVVRPNGVESTALGTLDIQSGARRILVTPDQASGNGAYAAFATSLAWRGADTLEAHLSDGDVGGVVVRVDGAGRLLERSWMEDADVFEIDPALVPVRARLVAAFPDLPAERFDAAAHEQRVVAGGDRVLLQNAYAGQRDDVLLYDTGTRRRTTLLSLEPARPTRWRLSGGARVGDALVFLVAGDSVSYVFEHTARRGLRRLGELPGARHARMHPLRVAGDTALLHVQREATRDLQDSPLLVYRAGRLTRVSDFPVLSGAAVDAFGRRIAFVHVRDGRRVITVKERR